MKNLNLLVRASIKSHKALFFIFSVFICFTATLIFISISIILPLGSSITNKITNHITNRELIYNAYDMDMEVIEHIRKAPNVQDVYKTPYKEEVTDSSKALCDTYQLSFFHKGYVPKITTGRMFKDYETGVAVVPEMIKDYNSKKGQLNTIKGKSLLGKILILKGGLFNYKAKVVGVYDNNDPLFDKKDIIIPINELNKLNNKSLNSGRSYIITVDNSNRRQNTMDYISEFCYVDINDIGIKTDIYTNAIYILFVVLGLFICLSVVGCYVLLKYNLSNRINEFALYKAVGYRYKHVFYIVFAEHLLPGIVAVAFSGVISWTLCNFLINNYVQSLLKNSIIDMNVSINGFEILVVMMFYIALMTLVCCEVVGKTNKMDLIILLKIK